MILNMMNIKIVILLSLVAYASCDGNGSSDDEPNKQNLRYHKLKNSESNAKPQKGLVRSFCCCIPQTNSNEAPVSTPTEKNTEAEVTYTELYSYLQSSFDDCYEWIKRANAEEAEGIKKEYFLKYMGEPKDLEPIFKNFFKAHPENDIEYYAFLNLTRFGQLFEYICKIKNVPVENMVEDRITSAKTRQLLPINTQIEDSDLAPAAQKTEEQLKKESDDLIENDNNRIPSAITRQLPIIDIQIDESYSDLAQAEQNTEEQRQIEAGSQPTNSDPLETYSMVQNIIRTRLPSKIDDEALRKDLDHVDQIVSHYRSASTGQKSDDEMEIDDEPQSLEDFKIQESFNDCAQWIDRANVKVSKNIKLEYFLIYMGKMKETKKICVDFFRAYPEKKFSDYESLNRKRYRDLFEYFCEQKKVSIENMVEDRKTSGIIRELPSIYAQYDPK
ncbi:uncharacterized protein LOC126847235 isoform X2 [Adelges cooleyi]|uniref:uncharacterized protein LOC126847235 isoform X2 n=1 Tax=Adelges cooleyi TaxID=133065 RepID=UPI00217F2678|nr:uncharacterized protein LOC126847235 isoform X2 [Adelges cooleyi]